MAYKFLKASSCRTFGRLPMTSGWRQSTADMCKIWLRIATQSIALRARKHFSSVIRNKVLFTPGLWKILSLVFSQSRTTFPTSCKQHRVKITSLYFNIFFILKADKVLYKQYSAILTKNSCKILLGCIASDILSGFGQRSV